MASVVPLRNAKRILREHGFFVVRQRSHEVWEDDTGRSISLPHKPTGGALYGFMAQAIRRIERGGRPAKGKVRRGVDDV